MTQRAINLAAPAAYAKPPPTRILVPVDLSTRSLAVSRYAAALAREFGSDLVFVHALKNGWPFTAAEKDMRARIVNTRGVANRFLIREGAPVPVILSTAEVEQVDLILIATRSEPRITGLFDRSITAQVLRGALCPVWAGQDDLPPLYCKPIRNILCGLSLGPRTSFVLRWAADLSTRLQANLSVIHASKELELAPDEIRELQASAGTQADVWLEPGGPLAAIPPLVDRLRADLLVIGRSPSRRFHGDLRLMSYQIVRRLTCPVASV